MISACSSSQPAKDYGKDAFIITGEMHFVDIESGCWQFVTADSVHYELTGKDTKALLKEGKRATIAVRELHNVSSVCMVGKIVELLEVIEIDNN